MAEQDHQPDWVVIAQAEGVLSARGDISITEAAGTLRASARSLGEPVDRVARNLMRLLRSNSGAGRPDPALEDGLDLEEEVALHEEMRRRRTDCVELDDVTASVLRTHLLAAPRL